MLNALCAPRTQISVCNTSGGYASIVRTLVQQKGIKALYQGFGPGLVNNSLTQALGFWFVEVRTNDHVEMCT